MPQGLIDTSALIGGLPPSMIDTIDQHCSSTIVRAELVRGLRVFETSVQQERVARRSTLLEALDEIEGFWRDFDVAASEGYGALTATSPQAVRQKDALIAGHAQSLGIPVITRDAGFTRFPSVAVVVLDRREV